MDLKEQLNFRAGAYEREPRKYLSKRGHSAKPNAETASAMKEALDISAGRVPAKSYGTVDELLKDLMSDADD